MKIIPYYEIISNMGKVLGRFASDPAEDIHLAKIPGIYRITRREFIVYDNVSEYVEHINNNKIQQALSKLSDEEIKLLGIKL